MPLMFLPVLRVELREVPVPDDEQIPSVLHKPKAYPCQV
jgi:hypothetical protein